MQNLYYFDANWCCMERMTSNSRSTCCYAALEKSLRPCELEKWRLGVHIYYPIMIMWWFEGRQGTIWSRGRTYQLSSINKRAKGVPCLAWDSLQQIDHSFTMQISAKLHPYVPELWFSYPRLARRWYGASYGTSSAPERLLKARICMMRADCILMWLFWLAAYVLQSAQCE